MLPVFKSRKKRYNQLRAVVRAQKFNIVFPEGRCSGFNLSGSGKATHWFNGAHSTLLTKGE